MVYPNYGVLFYTKKKWVAKPWKTWRKLNFLSLHNMQLHNHILLSERSQPEKLTYCLIPTMWHFGKVKLWEQQQKKISDCQRFGERGQIGGTQGIFRSVVVRLSCTGLLDGHKKELLLDCILVEACGVENNWRWALFSCTLTWLFKFCCSVTKSHLTFGNPMDCSTPGFPVLYHLLELAQTQVQWICDAIQPSPPLLSPSPPAFYLSQHQGLF